MSCKVRFLCEASLPTLVFSTLDHPGQKGYLLPGVPGFCQNVPGTAGAAAGAAAATAAGAAAAPAAGAAAATAAGAAVSVFTTA